MTSGDAASPTCALSGLCAADAFGHKARHARRRIKPRTTGTACVDDDADIGDGQGRFRDRCGQYDLATFIHGCNRCALGGKG